MLKDAIGDIHTAGTAMGKHTFHCDDYQRRFYIQDSYWLLILGELGECGPMWCCFLQMSAKTLPKYPAQSNRHLYSIFIL